MKLVKTLAVQKETPKNIYILEVVTMEGDADNYHSFKWYLDEKEVPETIVQAEVLKRQYPSGRGGDEGYDTIPFFNEWLDSWNCNDWGQQDSMDIYALMYFDELGIEYVVEAVFDDTDRKIIESYGILK